jgi:hypothetical protein
MLLDFDAFPANFGSQPLRHDIRSLVVCLGHHYKKFLPAVTGQPIRIVPDGFQGAVYKFLYKTIPNVVAIFIVHLFKVIEVAHHN